MGGRILLAISVAVAGLHWSMPVSAQMDLMRAQSRAIQRAVEKNTERLFKPKLVVSRGATGPVTALALSSDERVLVTAVGNDSLRLWDLSVGREIARLPGFGARILSVAITPDGRNAVTVGADRSVRAWDLREVGAQRLLGHHEERPTAAIAAGDRVFTAAADGRVRIWNPADGTNVRDFAAHGPGSVVLAASADGSRLVTGGADGRVRIWDTGTGSQLADFRAGSQVHAVAAARGGGLVVAATDDGEILAWNGGGEKIASFEASSKSLTAIALGADENTVLFAAADGSVGTGSLSRQAVGKPLGRHDQRVSVAVLSKDGSLGLTGSEDGTSRLWHLGSGTALVTMISTVDGWAVVDAKGRYDGSESALSGIDWRGDDYTANIEDFAQTHYQAALLPRLLSPDGEVADTRAIPEGVKYPPAVRFLSPSSSPDAPQGKVTVEVLAEDQGGGVADIRLYRNGKLQTRGGDLERRQEGGSVRVVGQYEIDLRDGSNVLAATAVNEEALESRPQQVVLGAGAPRTGKLHVLTVGINAYQDASLNLNYAKPDAQAINQFLTGGTIPLPLGQVIRIEDQDATRENILASLRKLREGIAPQDLVVVYMAGHGVSVGDEWFFISHEVKVPRQARQMANVALSSTQLKAEFENLPADRSILLLDTCHSGTAVSPLKDYSGMKALRLIARTVGTHILAATDRNQFAVELQQLGHGIFTYTVLAALRGEADKSADGQVTATELIRFAEENVPLLSRKFADYAQFPTGFSRGFDFVVARK